MPAQRPTPNTHDRDTGLLFDEARRGVLAIVECAQCHHILHPPRGMCDACGSTVVTTRPTSGRGSVYTWTVVEHQVHPAFDVPYTIIVVELDDNPGVRFIGHLDGSPDLEVGTPVEVVFADLGEGIVLPDWALVKR